MNFYLNRLIRLSPRNFTILSLITMAWAYIEIGLTKNIYSALCLFIVFICMCFATCTSWETITDYLDKVFVGSLYVSFLIYQTVDILLTNHFHSPAFNATYCIITVFLIIANLYCFILMIEQTQWYKNLERGREQLLEQEENGAEPDPKDFE